MIYIYHAILLNGRDKIHVNVNIMSPFLVVISKADVKPSITFHLSYHGAQKHSWHTSCSKKSRWVNSKGIVLVPNTLRTRHFLHFEAVKFNVGLSFLKNKLLGLHMAFFLPWLHPLSTTWLQVYLGRYRMEWSSDQFWFRHVRDTQSFQCLRVGLGRKNMQGTIFGSLAWKKIILLESRQCSKMVDFR